MTDTSTHDVEDYDGGMDDPAAPQVTIPEWAHAELLRQAEGGDRLKAVALAMCDKHGRTLGEVSANCQRARRDLSEFGSIPNLTADARTVLNAWRNSVVELENLLTEACACHNRFYCTEPSGCIDECKHSAACAYGDGK